MEFGNATPHVASVPGPRSRAWIERLALSESPAFTARRARRAEQSGANQDPIVWESARGCNVRDADGNVFVDLTSGFGVASLGHRHPAVLEAIHQQSGRLIHALGDVHPSAPKIALLERLCALSPFDDARAVLGLSGADALEVAIKSAVIATGKSAIVAFTGGYHGLSAGPLALCGYKAGFRDPFAAQLNPHVHFIPFPSHDFSELEGARTGDERVPAPTEDGQPLTHDRVPRIRGPFQGSPAPDLAGGVAPPGLGTTEPASGRLASEAAAAPRPGSHLPSAALGADQASMESLAALVRLLETGTIGAIVVEPIQGRGGVHVPPLGFLAELGRRAHAAGALVIADEIFTGLGRTGALLRSVHDGLDADLICVGKALGGGLPVSACVGRGTVMSAWGDPGAEAIHTGTFFGHPLGAATALATLDVIESNLILERVAEVGARFRAVLRALPGVAEVRGAGMLAGVRLHDHPNTLGLLGPLLARGYLTLPAGPGAEVLELIPPLIIDPARLDEFAATLHEVLEDAK